MFETAANWEDSKSKGVERDAYNEWNYGMIISVDADWPNLRNIDFPFGMPEIAATGNNGALFNYGVIVIEPSICTFHLVSYGSYQWYRAIQWWWPEILNEISIWWHCLPKPMIFWNISGQVTQEIRSLKHISLELILQSCMFCTKEIKPWL